ncbi:MAG TPA: uracil-DNA glycosylase [Candidatus Saccharimonadales bacterium]|nr:uracil-DNA glycosylase [Candidatus Saccharimonadales bacterium]
MSKADELRQVEADIVANQVCSELASSATQLVFADGSPDSKIVFIGEAPGAKEDAQGKPFVGAAGQFLNEMLESIGLKREQVYITNIVKYRPPGNRDPEPSEIEAFMPYLRRQIDIIKPKLIVFLGRHAMSAILPELKISQVHGQPKRKDGQVYLPLFHPAAALYNGSMRETLMEDFAKIPKILEMIE